MCHSGAWDMGDYLLAGAQVKLVELYEQFGVASGVGKKVKTSRTKHRWRGNSLLRPRQHSQIGGPQVAVRFDLLGVWLDADQGACKARRVELPLTFPTTLTGAAGRKQFVKSTLHSCG